MELRRYAQLTLKWLWLLILGTALASGVAYQISRSQIPVYRASLKLLVNQAQDVSGPDYSSLLASELLSRTYAELIKGEDVLAAATVKLGLRETPVVSVAVIRDTQLIELAVESEKPALARDFANAVSAEFIAQRVADQLGQSVASRDMLRTQIIDLEREMRDVSQSIEQARAAGQAQSGEISRLQGVLSQQQVTYAQLVRSESDIQLSTLRSTNSIKVVESAKLPIEPVRPRVLQNTLVAAVVGFLLALGLAFLVEYLDDTVKDEAGVAQAIDLPTLAVIGRSKNVRGERPLLASRANWQLAEAYRVLRLNIDFAWAGRPGKVIMVTSANPLEGKTTTAANLAMILAQDSRRVIIVDADLRRPSIHSAFDIDYKSGLTNLLADPTLAVETRLFDTRQANLRLLPSGPIPPNPAELLGSARFSEVLSELRSLADVIIIDTPPVLGAIDPAVVGTQADGTILVTAAGETRSGALERTRHVLERGSVRMLGVVLNKVSKGEAGYYRHYYYHNSTDSAPGSSNESGRSPNGKTKSGASVDTYPV